MGPFMLSLIHIWLPDAGGEYRVPRPVLLSDVLLPPETLIVQRVAVPVPVAGQFATRIPFAEAVSKIWWKAV